MPGKGLAAAAWMRRAMVLLAAALCVGVVYRIQLVNGFAVLGGDRFDAVISASILEHWHNVFAGRAWWSDAGYFYPHARTIAQTDGYFLVSIPYHGFRLLQMDPLLAQEITGMLVRFLGFLAFYVFCARGMGLGFWPSLVGSALFTTAAASSVFIHRTQLGSLAFAPLISFYLLRAYQALMRADHRSYGRNGAIAAVGFSLWCLTCFYLAWFYLYFLLLLFVSATFACRSEVVAVSRAVVKEWRWTVLIGLAGLVSAVPFIYAYGMKALEVGVRKWEGVERNLVNLWDVVLMHPGSLGGGALPGMLLPAPLHLPGVMGEYGRLGFSPLVIVVIIVGLYGLRSRTPRDRLMGAISLAAIVAAISVVRVGGFSLWQLVHAYLPGARALNAVSVVFTFLVFPTAVLTASFFKRYGAGNLLGVVALVAFMVLELNTPYVNLHRHKQLALLDVQAPPAECSVFFVGPLEEQRHLDEATQWIEAVYPHNVAALYLAQKFQVPTINGMASFNPPDWNFGHPARPDYEERVRAYLAAHQLQDVCRLDIEDKQWRML